MAFSDPIDWAHEWSVEQANMLEIEFRVEEEIENFKKDAIKRFHLIAPNFAEAIASTVAFGFNEGLTEAVKIVEYLFLNEKHIAALNGDSKKMNDILYKEGQEDKDFEHYISSQYD